MKVLDLDKLRKLVLDEKTATGVYSRFVAEPFEHGYGHTIGNSLRRILLSSLEGSAITSAKITGALHEFSILKGVKEDVAQIILNLKKIRVKLHSSTSEKIYLNVKKPGKVTARNIETNINVEIMNPEQEIANIDNGAILEIEMDVSMGKGYVLSEEEEMKLNKYPVGTIVLDSLFSPITKVNYEVENTRVEHTLNYDRLIMEIWTDGSISPKDALIKSAKILRSSLEIFIDDAVESKKIVMDKISEINGPTVENKIFDQLIDDMNLSTRTLNSLKNSGIKTIGDLVEISEEDILNFDNLGKRSFEEIKNKLKELNLTLRIKNGAKNDKNL
jgi:DNA-directed RNA polymerase subunit alpha